MKVSAIIATKNEQENILRLLKSLKAQSFKDLGIIVVDNYSSDNTAESASKYTNNVFSFGHERSSQRNFGAKKSRGDFLLFLDADMELQKTVVGQCVKAMENNPEISAVVIDEVSKGNSFLAKIKNLEKLIYQNEALIEAPRFFRKKDFFKIGGYDENLISGEDWDLAARIKKFGKIARIQAAIYHWENGSLWQDLQKKYYYAKNVHKYAAKNPQIFKKQTGFTRFTMLFSKPNLIFKSPLEFLGLLVLKTAHYFAYTLASK